MLLSAELRWFWPGEPPSSFETWFKDAISGRCAAGGGEDRSDSYLSSHGQIELGIKRRGHGGPVEVKGRVAISSTRISFDDVLSGPIEIWCKWQTDAVHFPVVDFISTIKTRWLRKFDTAESAAREVPLNKDEKPVGGAQLPKFGCNVEMTRIRASGDKLWWSLGFEAFGELGNVESSLAKTVQVMRERKSPALPQGICASYPAWLAS
jgi:hypothetical protein